jgi:hypothetical protein
MTTHTPVRAVRQNGEAAGTCDIDATRALPDWGAGLGIKTYGELEVDAGCHAHTTETVHVGPFLRWLDERIAAHGRQQTILDLGWNESDERRLHRWRFENVLPYVPVAGIEDALHRAGARLVEVYPETDVGEVLTTWCPKCKDAVIVDESLVCPWCDTVTETSVSLTFHHATVGKLRYTLTPEQRRQSALKRSRKMRYLTDEDIELARSLYQDQAMTMRQAADELWRQGRGRKHTSPERVEEALRRAFRRRGYATRTTAQSNAGVRFRGKLCEGTRRNGKPCEQSATSGSRYCFQHDPDLAAVRERRAHLARMRAKRAWVGKQIPMEPFVAWLTRRKQELALPVEQRRFRDRDESLTRLSAATGIDPSTLIKWMRYQSSKGTPKQLITPAKVREVLAHDATTTLDELYRSATVTRLRETREQLPAAA